MLILNFSENGLSSVSNLARIEVIKQKLLSFTQNYNHLGLQNLEKDNIIAKRSSSPESSESEESDDGMKSISFISNFI